MNWLYNQLIAFHKHPLIFLFFGVKMIYRLSCCDIIYIINGDILIFIIFINTIIIIVKKVWYRKYTWLYIVGKDYSSSKINDIDKSKYSRINFVIKTQLSFLVYLAIWFIKIKNYYSVSSLLKTTAKFWPIKLVFSSISFSKICFDCINTITILV